MPYLSHLSELKRFLYETFRGQTFLVQDGSPVISAFVPCQVQYIRAEIEKYGELPTFIQKEFFFFFK